jgi:hypothetical protein
MRREVRNGKNCIVFEKESELWQYWVNVFSGTVYEMDPEFMEWLKTEKLKAEVEKHE